MQLRQMGGLFLTTLLLVGCNPNPLDPPAAPPQIPKPTVLQFPKSILISTTAVEDSPSSLIKAASLPLLGTFGLDIVLAIVAASEIPVSADTKTFERDDLKFDFADFDLDGDGAKEGCSGSTGSLPVCFRVWRSGTRLMCGLFSAYPSLPNNKGAGKFRAAPASVGSKIAAVWDQQDITKLRLESFDIPDLAKTHANSHAVLTSDGNPSSALKLLKGAQDSVGDGGVLHPLESISRWKEGEDFWHGSLKLDGEFSAKNICLRISTGASLSPVFCQLLDTSQETFIRKATEDNAKFFDFPESPTF